MSVCRNKDMIMDGSVIIRQPLFMGKSRKMSLFADGCSKKYLDEKVERYRVLLEKEYERRSKVTSMQKKNIHEGSSKCCHCGHLQNSLERINLTSDGSEKLTTSYRNNGKTKQTKQRPKSVDVIDIRKRVAEEKATKRRNSITSLEEDFLKAKSIISRTRAKVSDETLNESFQENETSRNNTDEVEQSRAKHHKARPQSSYL